MTSSFKSVVELVKKLRDPRSGCPWSLAQTFDSLTPLTQEEVYELIEAIETHEPEAIRSELADLLLHVAFYSQLAEEHNWFNFADIEQHCIDKQLKRKPQLLEQRDVTQEEACEIWENIKAQDRGKDVFADLCTSLPALLFAKKVLQRSNNSDQNDVNTQIEKTYQQLETLKKDNEQSATLLAQLLMQCVKLCMLFEHDPEQLLRQATREAIAAFQTTPVAKDDLA